MAGRLAGKVAVVTGGAKGQGEGVARLFAAEGGRVAVLDMLDDPGARVAAAVGGRFFHCDVANEEDTRRLARAVAPIPRCLCSGIAQWWPARMAMPSWSKNVARSWG